MNLQLTTSSERGFARLRIVLATLICGLLFLAAPQNAFAQSVATTNEDTPTSFTVAERAGYEVHYIAGSASPAGSSGSVTGTTVFYTPAPNYHGVGTIDYAYCTIGSTTVCDPAITAQITVLSDNDEPIANDDPAAGNEADYEAFEGGTVTVADGPTDLLANDSDVDGPGLTAAKLTDPSHGTVVVNPDGSFTYTPDSVFFHGTDSFTYEASDGAGGVDSATATVTIKPILTPVELQIPVSFTETIVLTPSNMLITVPVHFDDRYEDIIGLNFDVDYDTSCLVYDSFNAVASQASTAQIGASEAPSGTVGSNVLTFAMYDNPPSASDPFVPLADGHILDILFMYNPACMTNPMTDAVLDIENAVPTALIYGNPADPGIETPNAHSFNIIQNTAPENISRFLVDPSSPGSGLLKEGAVNGTHFATLTTQETDIGDPENNGTNNATDHTYMENDTGCNGFANENALVELQGSRNEELHFVTPNMVLDFETMPQYRICVVSTDPHGASFEKRLFINVADMDEAPTDILIDDANDSPDAGPLASPGPASINEGVNNGLTVGTLSVDEMDVNDTTSMTWHSYEILSVTSMTGTVPTTTFSISGNQLLVGPQDLDHEKSDSYDVEIRAYDVYDQIASAPYMTPTLYVDAVITVNITDVNEPPTAIAPLVYAVSESTGVGTALSPAITTLNDPDSDEMFTYMLVWAGASGGSCTPPLHNNRFMIDASTGVITTDDFMNASSGSSSEYTICVRSEDKGGNRVHQEVVVDVTDNNLPPVANDDTYPASQWIVVDGNLYSVGGDGSLTLYGPAELNVLINDSDPNGDLIVVNSTSSSSTMGGLVEREGNFIKYTAPAAPIITPTPVPTSPPLPGDPTPTPPPFGGQDTFTYDVRDNQGGSNNTSNMATVSLTYVAGHQKGDCNGDGAINSNDFIMNVLEMFEFVGINWYEIHEYGQPGSPWGCNSQRDTNINIQDVICTVNTFFGNTCGGLVTASSVQAPATLSLGAKLTASAGETIDVPIVLSNGGDAVAGAGFYIEIDADALGFDATDANGDGIPDAVNMNIPASSQAIVEYDAEASQLKFALFGNSLPMASIADGTLATITVQVNENVTAQEAALRFVGEASLSDSNSHTVPVTVEDNSIAIQGASDTIELYLPLSLQ